MEESLHAKQRLEEVIRTYADMIYRLAYQNTKSRADADDIFQEVCLSLLTKNPPLDNPEHLKFWLVRVTLNKCSSLHASAWRRRTQALDETLVREDESREVLDAVMRLPQNYRNAVYLHYYEGYSVAEIGRLTGKSPNTVASWLMRGRKRLKGLLTDETEEIR